MTEGMNAEISIEIYGIEVDDEDVRGLIEGTLSEEDMYRIVYEGINGNRMELKIIEAKLVQM